ncbi:KAT8 regulatory NSL complex subunit 3-like [Varroa jacobsoni]|uniref:KAT8 regulatory NSL complex subunit 3 n=1 Tax=Varroa destructor TaxID=109461 RepID=A0A7M7KUK7_VARDE|nr:KAT8 regulatory NSL complex subunit 3-like [Varroa destructor]XP_022694457.1 KAT8 regulatory NSL complex subunit 3-like [Varroa jacobsoni]
MPSKALTAAGCGSVLSFLPDETTSLAPEVDAVAMDHTYARSWNSHPVSVHARPATLLFVNSKDQQIGSTERLGRVGKELFIDVESVAERTGPSLGAASEQAKCKALIDEVERHVRTQQKCIPDEIWDEERISRHGWTRTQISLFDRMYKILDMERVARLAYDGSANEFVSRRISLDKAARRVRQLYVDVHWEQVLLQWLHATIIENLPVSYCSSYVEILQTLNAKIPSLVQRLFSRCSGGFYKSSTANDSLLQLLKRPWDPAASLLSVNRPKKLPGPPIFIVVPSGLTQNPHFARVKFWYNHLAHLGKLITIPIPIVNEPSVTVAKQLEVTVNAVKSKIGEVKTAFPQRPIILVGWNSGALVALQTSLIESVSAVVCMGFPMTGLQGPKQLDDPILDSRTPILFCVGQFDRSCSLDDLEDFRGYMKCETGVVVVGGGDANLHMSTKHKRLLGMTQTMVDRCIVEEIFNFLNHALSSITSPPPPPPGSPVPPTPEKKTTGPTEPLPPSLVIKPDGPPTPANPRKYRKRERSQDDDGTMGNSNAKRGPGRPRTSKHSSTQSRATGSSSKTSPVLEPSQTVTHAAATTATSVLTKDLPKSNMRPVTAHVRKSDQQQPHFLEGTHHNSPPKNPISIGKIGSLSGLGSQQGSLMVSPVKEEHRMVNPQDVLGMAPVDR